MEGCTEQMQRGDAEGRCTEMHREAAECRGRMLKEDVIREDMIREDAKETQKPDAAGKCRKNMA